MTKRIQQIGGILIAMAIVSSCNKAESISSSDTTVGSSKIIFFPSLKIKGEDFVVVYVGDTYTDEGATAILNEKEIEYTTSGTVDASTPGIYQVDYEAKNAEGYTAGDYRTVVVIDGDEVEANDFSGTYARFVNGAPNGQTSTWTKTGVGVYSIENPGGATGLTVTGVNYKGKTVVVPNQHSSAGAFASTEAEYNVDATPNEYAWAIINGGYGPAVRTFKKQ